MPTSQEIDISKLGIIAGGGSLPAYLASICEEKEITPYIVGFDKHTDPELMDKHQHLWTHLGAAGKIMDYFHAHGVKDLVMIGHVKRPSFIELKPDLKAIKILSQIGFKAIGDNSLLTALKSGLEKEGFTVRGIHDFCDQLLIREGTLGKHSPTTEDMESIQVGVKTSQAIGALDIGQSVIVQNGIIVGVEAVSYTHLTLPTTPYV